MTGLRHRHLLLRSHAPPRPDGDGQSRRLFHVVKFLRAAGCAVTSVARAAEGVAAAGPLAALGATVVAGDDEQVERLARSEHVDWVLLGGWRVAEPLVAPLRATAPGTRIVVDAGDVRSRWRARRMRGEAEDAPGARVVRDTSRELAVYAAADAVLAASRTDADLVADLIGDHPPAFVVPDSEDREASPFPFRRRRGMFLAGDFSQRVDVDALAWIGDHVLPHVDPAALADNPLSVTGGHMTDDIRAFAADWPTVRMLGRVPSVVPYLERVRVVLVPLPHPAGLERLLIQSLTIGTPAVATSVAIEGVPCADEREVLLADDPVRFAAAITRLLTDEPLWDDLARAGRRAVRARHGHDQARGLLRDALVAIRDAAPPRRWFPSTRRMTHRDYEVALGLARDAIVRGTPPGAVVAVVSRGDVEAVRLAGRTGWHFPRGDEGDYAGWYPATASEAIDHLEAVRGRGAEFLAIPAPSLWWLGHYPDLRAHLESRYRVIEAHETHGVLVSLAEPPAGPQSLASVAATDLTAGPSTAESPATTAFAGLSDRHAVTRSPGGPPPAISIVIAAGHGGAMLTEVLESLARQTVEPAAFEVVVVSDGSRDGTAEVSRAVPGRLRLTLVESPPAGTAVARNLGIDAATAPLVLFLDDDAVADPGLVAAHLAAQRRYPLEHVAVLGSTVWHPRLPVTELMRFVTDEAHRLFGSVVLHDGQPLDTRDFRAAGASCKKSLLVRAGGFQAACAGGADDVEAAHRIGRMLAHERPRATGHAPHVGLAVVACPDAVRYLLRPVTFADWCERCERRGWALRRFGRGAADPLVDDRLGEQGVRDRWCGFRDALATKVARVHELERLAAAAGPDRERVVRELHELYAWTFDAFTTKGMAESADTE